MDQLVEWGTKELHVNSWGFYAIFGTVIYVGFGVYDWVILPLISKLVTGRLPEKAKKLYELAAIDRAFITFNRLVAIPFIYHAVQVSVAYTNIDVFDQSALSAAMWRLPLHLPLIFVIYDFFYTWLHWALHIPGLYPLIHKHHHRQLVPFRGNVDAINVHPIEYLLGEYNHLLAVFLSAKVVASCGVGGTLAASIPPALQWAVGPAKLHCVSAFAYIIIAGTLSSLNHTRTDVAIPYLYQVWWHDYHHRQPRCNYGQYIMFWDWVFGWFKPRSCDTRKWTGEILDDKAVAEADAEATPKEAAPKKAAARGRSRTPRAAPKSGRRSATPAKKRR